MSRSFFTIFFPVFFYVLCFTRPRYQVSVYRTIGPLVLHEAAKYRRGLRPLFSFMALCNHSLRHSIAQQ